VCQDFAHFMIGLCRALKIPRATSAAISPRSRERHARWMEVFVPGHGWRGLDPTHNCQVGEQYVKIGNGRDYGDVPPISGNYRGTRDRQMQVEVKITAVV